MKNKIKLRQHLNTSIGDIVIIKKKKGIDDSKIASLTSIPAWSRRRGGSRPCPGIIARKTGTLKKNPRPSDCRWSLWCAIKRDEIRKITMPIIRHDCKMDKAANYRALFFRLSIGFICSRRIFLKKCFFYSHGLAWKTFPFTVNRRNASKLALLDIEKSTVDFGLFNFCTSTPTRRQIGPLTMTNSPFMESW